MGIIEEVIKKVKELKSQEERISYLEGLLKILKDKKTIERVKEMLKILKEPKENKDLILEENPIIPRREIHQTELEIKYEQQPRRAMQSPNLERTVEAEKTEPKETITYMPDYGIREQYIVDLKRESLQRTLQREKEDRRFKAQTIPYTPEFERSRRDMEPEIGRQGELINTEQYQIMKEGDLRIPSPNVRENLEKDMLERYRKIKPIRTEK